MPIVHSHYNNAVTPNSFGFTVRSELAADEATTFPGNLQECSPELFPRQADRVTERTQTITWSRMRIRAWGSLNLRLPTTAPQSLIYVIFRGQVAMMNTYIELLFCPTAVYGTHTYNLRKS